MDFYKHILALALTACVMPVISVAQTLQSGNPCQVEDKSINPATPQGVSVEQIIQRFAAKEAEFKEARDQYTYRQDVKVQTIDGNTSTGEYREVVDITFRDDGKRTENVVFAPQSTLQAVSMEAEDLDDIRNRYPFVLTSAELPLYQILYVGQQRVDEIDTYVFDIAPKQIEKNKRYFQGRIWVDTQDLQIVKTCGRPAYQPKKQKRGQESLYPSFTSYREQIDGKYWFPTYARADEVLAFSTGDVHIRIIVKYTDYKRFQAKSKIIFTGEEAPEDPKQEQPKPEPPKQEQPK
jgi:hypothetical protein